MRKLASLSLLTVIGLAFVACGPKPEEVPAIQTTTEEPKKEEPEKEAATKVETPAVSNPDDPVSALSEQEKADRAKIKIEILKPGKGDAAANGDKCFMEYTGTLVDGKVFDSNANGKREPFAFVLGAGNVIRGWDLGVLGMKPGEERRLTIPSPLGYGDQGAGADIPGGATLVFTIKLFDTLKPEDASIFDVLASTEGSGAGAKAGDKVKFHVEVKLLNGTQVFNSAADDKPIEVTLGDTSNGYSTGLMAALDGAKAGSKLEVRMPPLINVGTESQGAKEQLLKYTIKVISVGK